MLEVRELSKSFGGLLAVDRASLDVRQGEIVGLIGPNGAGKTALFAAIVLQPGKSLSPDQVIEHCRARIGGYKVPRQMVFLPQLPKSAMGKILKTEIRKEYSDPNKRAG